MRRRTTGTTAIQGRKRRGKPPSQGGFWPINRRKRAPDLPLDDLPAAKQRTGTPPQEKGEKAGPGGCRGAGAAGRGEKPPFPAGKPCKAAG